MRNYLLAGLTMSLGIVVCVALCHAADASAGPPVPAATPLPASTTSAPSPAGDPANDPGGLSRRISELRLDGVPLDDALRTLAEKTKANISVHWEGLADAGVQRTTPVRLHVWDVNLGQALSILLAAACPPGIDREGQPAPRLGFTTTENVVTVSAASPFTLTTTVVYNVRDLIEMHLDSSIEPPPDPQRQVSSRRDEAVEALCKTLSKGVAPDSWRQSGGAIGSCAYFGGLLVIRQTPENQREVAALLQRMRDADRKLPWSAPAATQPAPQSGTSAAGQ
jgi:hypothetical protein